MILQEYKIGISIFNLPGFEYHNKKSKTVVKRFYNDKYNICIQVMNRIFNSFFFLILVIEN